MNTLLSVVIRFSLIGCLWLSIVSFSWAQGVLQGKVTDNENKPIVGATILLQNTSFSTFSDNNGTFTLKNIPFGNYQLVCYALGKDLYRSSMEISSNPQQIQIILLNLDEEIDALTIQAERERTFGLTRLKAVEDFGIYEGKKTEVIDFKDLTANLATNNPRQVYAKITGLNIWESDGAGLQLGIGGRGLSPNRTANFNVRQNGYDISADALGYPESYYTPPTEALERIEIIRGAAALQYGTQFGGMVNFKFRKGVKDKKFELLTRQSIGSWGFFNSFNSIGGTAGKLNYYAYAQYKRGDGYRPNSQFDYYNIYTSINYQISPKLLLNAEVTKMSYLAKQAGGLTDKAFSDNPRQSIRNRNWFFVDWNLFALNATYEASPRTQINTRNFVLFAQRQSLGNLERINVVDFGNNRTLIQGNFQNFGNETRLLHQYRLGEQKQTFLVGTRIYQGFSTAKQGDGDNGSEANFKYLNPDNLENSDYQFPNKNYSLFAENIFNLSEKFSLTPGMRLESILTRSEGYYKTRVFDGAGNLVSEVRTNENLSKQRSFLIFGLGASYKLNGNWELYGNFSQNYRAINFTDLRIVNPNFIVDKNIKDETGYTADIGFRGNIEHFFNFEMTAFYLRYNGRIGQVLRADLPPLFIDYRFRGNIADARNIGVEMFGEINLLKILKKDFYNKDIYWTVFTNLALVDARYINTQDNAIRNKQVEMVPPIMLRTGTTFKHHRLSSTLQFAHTQEHFSDATNAVRTSTAVEGLIPSYQVLDFSVSYTYKKLTFEGSINNALNAAYFTRRAESYPGPGIIPADGRGFYLTLQGKF
jgi:Fe(3+) dicitrate transport protein